MGSPPLGLPTVVERRKENRVTGAGARTDRRSLATMVPTPQEAASQSRPWDSATEASQEEHIGKRVGQQQSSRSVPCHREQSIVQKAQSRSVPGQRRSLPSTGAVKTPSSATWRVIPLRLSAGRWAVQKAGYISGKIAMRPASPTGFRSVLGVPGASRPKRLKRSQGPSSAYATAYRQTSHEASVRK